MIRRFATLAFPYLLAISLLMLLVGSAWHVHDHDHGAADACVWCLAAMVVVLAVSAFKLGFSLTGHGFVSPALHEFSSSRSWGPKASRAPPAL